MTRFDTITNGDNIVTIARGGDDRCTHYVRATEGGYQIDLAEFHQNGDNVTVRYRGSWSYTFEGYSIDGSRKVHEFVGSYSDLIEALTA